MNKIFLLLFAVLLFARNLNPELSEFDKSFLISSKQEQLAIHQKLKTIYIKSIISGDTEEKKEVLKRIILSSKVLLLDASSYEKELKELGIDVKSIKKPSTNVAKKSTEVPEKKNIFYITKITEDKNKISFKTLGEFDLNTLKKSQYNKGEIKNKILEFDGVLDTKKQTFTHDDYELSVVQYNPKRIRIVARSMQEIELELLNESGFSVELTGLKDKKAEQMPKKTVKTTPKKAEESKTIIETVPKKLEAVKQIEQTLPKKTEALKKVTETPKKEQISNKIKAAKKVEQVENSETLKGINNISKVIKLSDGIKLANTYELRNLKNFTYGQNHIIEFDGVLLGGRKNFDYKGFSISVLQFNPTRIRVVLNSKTQQKLFTNINEKESSFTISKPEIINNSFRKRDLLITIDAGHGGKDTGANAFGRSEKNITLQVALKLSKALKNKGYKVFLTRSKDVYIGLRDRTKMANDKRSDLFISIHANSIADKSKIDKIHGIETYFLSPARSERSKNAAALENKSDIEEMTYFSKQTFLNFLNREKIISSNKLAIDIQGGILSAIPKNYLKKDGGVKEAPFWVLVGALMPAVLIEIGYISHPIEGKNIADSKYQDYLVNGIVAGIENYFIKNK